MRNLLLFIFFMFISSCANPKMPTGGPPDKQPPLVLKTNPENGVLNFKGNVLRFDFDEYVQQSSFRQAFRIEPNVDVTYKIKFKGKSVLVEFEKPLPEQTTIVATLGVSLTDFKSNKLKEPFKLALSTGDVLNTAQIHIPVLNAKDGLRAENVKVFLIPSDKSFTDKALYTAETDTSGLAKFAYLPEQTFKILLVEDVNRNRTWDSFEWAQPANVETITAIKDSTILLSALHYLRPDTIKPRLEGVGIFAANRLRLRFSEPVFPLASANFFAFSKSDSIPFWVAYAEPDNPTVYWALSESGLVADSSYIFPSLPFQDQFRNTLDSNDIRIVGEALKDTVMLRILEVSPKEQLVSNDTLKVLFNGIVTTQILDSLTVIEQENQLKPYSFAKIEKNRLCIYPETAWDAAYSYQFRIYNPATQNYLTHSPKIIQADDLGSLSIRFPFADSAGVWITEISGTNYYNRITSNDSVLSVFQINDASVLVRVFRDENQNDKWDSGTIIPFKRPEWFYINPKVAIKPKMNSELEIIF